VERIAQMPDQGGSYGMKGFKGRALELPDGTEVAVSPDDRARIRYNHPKLQLEQSIDQGDYIPLSAVPSEDILSQASWYISTSGSDSNDGATSSTALRSHAELMRRIGGGEIRIAVTVHVLGNALALEDCHEVWSIGINGSVRYLGYVLATLASGTMTAVTDIYKPNNIPFDITDTNLSDTWANLGLINERIRITGGAREGAIAWVVKDLGAKKARVSEWKISSYPLPAFSYDTVNAQVGDPYVVESLPSVQRLHVNAQVAPEGIGLARGKLLFENLRINTDTSYISNMFVDQGVGIQFLNCYLNGRVITLGGGIAAFNCLSYYIIVYAGISYLNGGVNIFALLCQTGSHTIWIGFMLQGGFGVAVTSIASLRVEEGAGVDPGGVGVFDQSVQTFLIEGKVSIGAPFFGSGNASYALDVSETGFVSYLNVAELTATAATGDTVVGGTPKAYGALPFFNVSNGAGIVAAT
jgi:hypothetical protein